MIGQLGNFLDHFLDLILRYGIRKARCFDFEETFLQHKLAVVKVCILLQQVLQVEGISVLADLGRKKGLVPSGYCTSLSYCQDGLKTTTSDGNNYYRLTVIVISVLSTNLLSVLLNVIHDIHKGFIG